MERLYTFIFHNIGCLCIYSMIDYFLCRVRIKAEWLQLRAIGNGLVVACTYQDVVLCMADHNISWASPLYPYAEPLVFFSLSLSMYYWKSAVQRPVLSCLCHHTHLNLLHEQ